VKRRSLVTALAVAAMLTILVANATVFAYRWMEGTVSVAPADKAKGAACTGFYSSAEQSGIPLPDAGTNYNAKTYAGNTINITPGDAVCTFTYNGNTYNLYESISFAANITVGTWIFQDIYGFGYNGTSSDPVVYVYIKVDEPINDTTVVDAANLTVYLDGSAVGTLDLTNSSDMIGPITLSPGQGLQIDIVISAASNGTVAFKVGFYVSEQQEEPR